MYSRNVGKWIPTGLLVLGAGVLVYNGLRPGNFNLGGFVFGLVVVAVVLGVIMWSNSLRLRAVRRMNPDAFVANIVVYPQLVSQLAKLHAALGLDVSLVKATRYCSVWIDKADLKIFAGAGAPREILKFDASSIVASQIVRSPQGNWNLESLELSISTPNGVIPLDVCLGEFPTGVRGAALQRALEDAERALGRIPS